MLDSQHVRGQRVAVSVAKNGDVKHVLVVETNLDNDSPEMTELLDKVRECLANNNQIDSAEINCRTEIS